MLMQALAARWRSGRPHRRPSAAQRLARSHPDVAARIYLALGTRILTAKKSKYYDTALSHFENARRCYERAGLHGEWTALVANTREAHHRKAGFMAGFERLAAGHISREAFALDFGETVGSPKRHTKGLRREP
jgi:hypothetical protein